MSPITTLLEEGNTPEQILEKVLGDLDMEVNDTMPVRFRCSCSRERVEKVLISLGKKELQNLIDEGQGAELNCHFCNRNYGFTTQELRQLLSSRQF